MLQVRRSHVFSISLAFPSFPLQSSAIVRGLTDALLGGGTSTLLAEFCQHPQVA